MRNILKISARWSAVALGLLASQALLAQGDVTPLYEVAPASTSTNVYLEASLPAEIYRYTDSTQLNDILVLDRDGAILPSRIHTADPGEVPEPEVVGLNFFPVLVGTPLTGAMLPGKTQLQIEKGSIAISLDPSEAQPSQDEYFYLIDLRKQDKGLQSIVLSWPATPASQYVVVNISGSKDLRHWQRVASDTLVQLEKGDSRLLRNRIELKLTAQQYDFLRIEFPNNPEVPLTAVQASLVQLTAPVPELSWSLTGVLAEQQKSVIKNLGSVSAWEYRRGDKAPIEQLSLNLSDMVYGANVQLYSRQTAQDVWRQRYRGVWFNAKVGDEWQQSQAINVYANTDSQWRVELSDGLQEQITPKLVFYHPQQVIQFIANNNGPYRIGKTAEVPQHNASKSVFDQLLGESKNEWVMVDLKPLENVSLTKEKEPKQNWTDIVFWFSLAVAVIVLALFAVKLLRQLQREDE